MPFLEDMLLRASRGDATKYRVVNALITCLERKRYDDVSINDICALSGISRQTFYRHYSSKHEVCPWFWDQIAKRYAMQVGLKYTWRESFLRNFKAAEPYLGFFTEASKTTALDSPGKHGFETRRASLEDTLVNHVGIELTPLLKFEIEFFATAESQVELASLERQGFTTPEAIAGAYVACVPNDLREIIDGHVERQRAKGAR